MSLSAHLVSHVAIDKELKGYYPRKESEPMVNDFPHQPWKQLFVILLIVVNEREAIMRPVVISEK